MISATKKIQIKFQKTEVLEGKKINWGRGNTWANDTSHTTSENKPTLNLLYNLNTPTQVEEIMMEGIIVSSIVKFG